MSMLKNIKYPIIVLLVACITYISASALANSGPYVRPIEYYQEHLRSNVGFYIYKGSNDTKYNCLAYVLGVTTATIWPWGGSNPSASEMTSVLNQFGYSSTNNGPPSNPPKLIVYGTLNNVGHIAKVTSSTSTASKWGPLEIVDTYSLSPYNSSPGYGPAVQYYY
ncbi:hypothetical protein SAMN02799616_01167 [Paenibacillus sp. UNC499MF]|nr:hypothetical protein SAMN02799616_01167 [Paenibacillus sp. UNC499MF]